MADKFAQINESLNKKDLELILEVNKKAIQIESDVADQHEEILDYLSTSKDSHDKMHEKLDKTVKQVEETAKEVFQMKVLFIVGLLNLVVQIIQIFLKK